MPRLPDRRRTRCAMCALRRLCWLVKVRTIGWHVADVPVCDECVFTLPRYGDSS